MQEASSPNEKLTPCLTEMNACNYKQRSSSNTNNNMGKKATVSLKKTKHNNNKNKPPTQQDNRMELLQMALAEAIE